MDIRVSWAFMADNLGVPKRVVKYRRVFRASAILSLLQSLSIVVNATQVSSLAVPLSILRLSGGFVLAIGMALVIASALLTIFPSRWGISLLMLQIFTMAAFALGVRERRQGDLEIDPFLNESASNRIWLNSVDWCEPDTNLDPELAYRGLANARARIHHRDFDAVYHLRADGYRVMPVPKKSESAPIIVLLGCSVTFGAGCADDETYAALLAEKAWPRYRVENWSVSGWGTMQAAVNVD